MMSRLPVMTASKDETPNELTTALAALNAAERGDDAEIERGQCGPGGGVDKNVDPAQFADNTSKQAPY